MNHDNNCSYCPSQPVRRAIAIAVAAVLVLLAFGVGLPWIIADAPLQAETPGAPGADPCLRGIPPLAPDAMQAPRHAARQREGSSNDLSVSNSAPGSTGLCTSAATPAASSAARSAPSA